MADSWIFFAQWTRTPEHVYVGYSENLQASLDAFFYHGSTELLVLKAFKGSVYQHQKIRDRFLADQVLKWWFHYSPSIAAYIREEALCNTDEARELVGRIEGLSIRWRPADASSQEMLRRRRQESLAPKWAQNSTHFVLWAAGEYLKEEGKPPLTPSVLYDVYKASSIYDFKTMRNRFSELVAEGRLKCTDKGYVVTDLGRDVMNALEKSPERKSVRSLTA